MKPIYSVDGGLLKYEFAKARGAGSDERGPSVTYVCEWANKWSTGDEGGHGYQ